MRKYTTRKYTTRKYIYHDYTYHDGFRHRKKPFYHSYFIMKCGINIILRLLLWYFYYGNGKSNRGTVIVVKRVFSLAKTIVVDVFVIYIPRIPLWYFLLWVLSIRDEVLICPISHLAAGTLSDDICIS